MSVVPPSESDPVPVRPWPGVQVITSELTVMPEATDKLPRDMVKEPEVVPEVLVTLPAATAVPPKSDTEPFALKVQLFESV